MELLINDLHVNNNGSSILKGVNLKIEEGEVHALMGPNGSGKSTLSYTIMGHPSYQIKKGTITFGGEEISGLRPDERSKMGLFLAFQYPVAVPGVSVGNFLRQIYNIHHKGNGNGKPISIFEFQKMVKEKLDIMKIDHSFLSRYLNDEFSGGEKKRLEMLQLDLISPRLSFLDEPDSGLDIDALKVVADGINRLKEKGIGALVITHYRRILDYIKPEKVHVMLDGKIVLSGGPEISDRLEEEGYDWLKG